MKNYINKYFETVSENFLNLKSQSSQINAAVKQIVASLKTGNKIIFCGNGGSASDAQHLATELIGRYKDDRPPLAAIAITTDTSALTAIGNDYGFENIFSRQIIGIGKPGDTLVVISTSGKSKNVIDAANTALANSIKVIGFTGQDESELSRLCDICINAQSKETNHIQEMHIAIGQLICEIVEKEVFK
jgi:D-sedoheptulose 7-phosphate isomerase